MNATKGNPTPRVASSGSQTLDPSQRRSDTHSSSAGVDLLTDDQRNHVTHGSPVGELPATSHRTIDAQSKPAGGTSSDSSQTSNDTHASAAAVGSSSSQPSDVSSLGVGTSFVGGWLELRIWAEMFDDAQKARIANANRAERGGVDPLVYQSHLKALEAAEHQCGLAMRHRLRRVASPQIIEWQKNTKGIGEHLLARLLGHLGHPVWATPHHWEGQGNKQVLITDPPFERTVGQLWQYCGHGAPARKTKGMTAAQLAAQGDPSLKMIVHLISEACMKTMSSPYRLVYEDARITYADKTHTATCVRCGPSGKPAQIGDPWSAGHQHAAALRRVGKEFLRDLWRVAS